MCVCVIYTFVYPTHTNHTHSLTHTHTHTHTQLERPNNLQHACQLLDLSRHRFHIQSFYDSHSVCLWVPYQRGVFLTPLAFLSPSLLSPSPPLFSQDMLDSLSDVYGSLKEEDLWCERESCNASLSYYQSDPAFSRYVVYTVHCAHIHTVEPLCNLGHS